MTEVDTSQELVEEQADLDGRTGADRGVGGEQGAARDEAGAGAECAPDEGVDRSGVRDVPRELDEAVGHQRHADDGEDESPRRPRAEDLGGADPEQRHRPDRADEPDGERGGVGDLQFSA